MGLSGISLLAVVYAIGDPLILWCLTWRKSCMTPSLRTDAFWCHVWSHRPTMRKGLDRREIRNILHLHHPKEALDVVVLWIARRTDRSGSSGGFADRGLRLVRQEKRWGKYRGLEPSDGSV